MQTLYSILGVELGASLTEIKHAYRDAVLKFHPDRNSSPSAKEKFLAAEKAYSILSDKEKRAAYDRSIRPPAPSRHGPRSGQIPIFLNRFGRRRRRGEQPSVHVKVHWNSRECGFCGGTGLLRSFRDGHFLVDPCPQCR